MKSPWNKRISLIFIVILVGGAAWLWLMHKQRVAEESLVDMANAQRIRAEQGDPKAETELAYMYSHGQGVPQDYGEALRWRRKSAEQGYAAGEVGLAYMYLHGQGVTQSDSEALGWYRRAADSGDAYAENSLGNIYIEGRLVPPDYSEALRWYRKAVEQSYPAAEYNLGNMYYYGHGLPRDIPEAYRWYRKAAAKGDTYSQRVLGLRGRGINAIYAFSFALGTVGCLLLLVRPLSHKATLWNRPWQTTTIAGVVGLFWVGLSAYTHSQFCVFPSELFAIGFTFVRYGLSGFFLFLLILALNALTPPKIVRILFWILGGLFLSFNALAVAYMTAHQFLWSTPAAARLLASTNGLIAGMAIPLAISLLSVGQDAAETK